MLKGIWSELVLIRQELQAIRSSMEFNPQIVLDERTISQVVQQSIDDTSQEDGDTF